jgi:hypothetical protein
MKLLYCETHNRGFRTQSALDNHYNSSAHQYDEYYDDDVTPEFYCETHDREFRTQSALDMHYNSSAHQDDEFYDEEVYIPARMY